MARSQQDRLWAAVSAARSAPAINAVVSPCNAAGRAKFAKKVLDRAWVRKNFTRTRTTIAPRWTGDQLTTIVEIAHYMIPRQTWAVPRSNGEQWIRREVCFTVVALVQHMFGRAAGKAMRESFKANGVKYRPRRKASAAQKAALKGRQFKPKKIEAKIAVLDRALVNLGKQITSTREAIAHAKVITKGRRRITFDDE